MPNYNPQADYTQLKVIYEDNHIIAVYKPSGILVQGDSSGDITLIDVVRKYLAINYNKSGNVYLGLVHRLDKPASGLVIFAKTSKGASRLSKQFREHSIIKIYYAMVEGKMKSGIEQTLKSYLIRDKDITKVVKHLPESKYAELTYQCIKSDGKNSLLEVQLVTGRKHQIRSQLSAIGYPIIGDIKYGAKSQLGNKDAIALICKSISFTHPTKKEPITLRVDLPKEWIL
jgi:23S rRNA pseudouridine1911/1915/1917 synthase